MLLKGKKEWEKGQAWLCRSIIPALRRLKEKEQELKSSLDYVASSKPF
jgi:hypothetical protein